MAANIPSRRVRSRTPTPSLPPPAHSTLDATQQSAARLPRALLEEAFTRLTEENARLRRELSAPSSLWQIAHQDPLTHLWNRRYADQRLAEEASRAKRESGYKFSLVLIDVDHMKQINDQSGHAAGDEALRWVASFLKHGSRGHDVCCRVGGDEFLLILPGSGEKDCRELVRRLGRRWATAAEEAQGAVAVSIGTASFPSEGRTAEELFTVADEAMYTNKRRHVPTRMGHATVAVTATSAARRAGVTPTPPGDSTARSAAAVDRRRAS